VDSYNLEDKASHITIIQRAVKRSRLSWDANAALVELNSVDTKDYDIDSALKTMNDLYLARQLVELASEISSQVQGGDSSVSVIESARQGLNNIADGVLADDCYRTLGDTIDTSEQKHALIYDGTHGISGIPAPIPAIDLITGKFRKGRFYVIAARPSTGKSALVAQIAYKAASLGFKVLFFSFEMDADSIWRRILSAESGILAWDMEIGFLSEEEKQEATTWLDSHRDIPLYIVPRKNGKTIAAMNAAIRGFTAKIGTPDLVIVDYTQLMKAGVRTTGRYEEMTYVSNALMDIPSEHNTALIALSQMSRAMEKRDYSRPQLSDLRETGALEQDSDCVSFLWRPDMHANSKDGQGGRKDQETYPDGYTELIFEKNRQGRTGCVKLKFDKVHTKFMEMGEDELYGASQRSETKATVRDPSGPNR
jgi:replicative DNA helicase